MIEHKQTYLSFYGLRVNGDYKKCEIPWCGKQIQEIHHIDRRGMGGTTHEYKIEELMGLCKEHHHQFGEVTFWKPILKKLHLLDMITHKKLIKYKKS